MCSRGCRQRHLPWSFFCVYRVIKGHMVCHLGSEILILQEFWLLGRLGFVIMGSKLDEARLTV